MTEPIIFISSGFTLFIIIMVMVRDIDSKIIEQQLSRFQQTHFQLLLKKEVVQCNITRLGAKTPLYHFSKADLYFYENAFIIVGYNRIFKKKLYHHIIIFTNETETYQRLFPHATITLPRKFNPNSFGGDVYIEFGKASFTSTNVTIRLKGLSEEEKALIFIQ